MAETTSQRAAQEISRQIKAFLGSTIEPGFVVIRYPPGYNFNVQYNTHVYTNPHTLNLIDQLCTLSGKGAASMTGQSFSAKFAAILGAVGYNTSSADKAAQDKALKAYDKQTKALVKQFESDFGRIKSRMIQASKCIPQTKEGYVAQYISTNYPGSPPSFPPILAALSAVYDTWFSMGQQLNKSAGRMQRALDLVKTATANTVSPSAQNGGMQTDASTWAVAYSGLPSNNAIVASLTDLGRKVTVTAELKSANGNAMNLRLGTQDIGAIPGSELRLSVTAPGAKAATMDDLWKSADRIEMEIVYSGITVLRADPVEIAPDLSTGWFSRQILSDIVAKTGKDVTGLQLQGSTFAVGDLFGPGKSFARVRTFVISQEPTVTLRFHGVATTGVAARFPKDQPAQLELDDIVTFGSSSADYTVLDVATRDDVVTVTLGPPTPVGTIPTVDQTAHVIGGVPSFPP